MSDDVIMGGHGSTQSEEVSGDVIMDGDGGGHGSAQSEEMPGGVVMDGDGGGQLMMTQTNPDIVCLQYTTLMTLMMARRCGPRSFFNE